MALPGRRFASYTVVRGQRPSRRSTTLGAHSSPAVALARLGRCPRACSTQLGRVLLLLLQDPGSGHRFRGKPLLAPSSVGARFSGTASLVWR
ncbi:hypothetical protein MTO96_022299 [Rhipicephalus appendiculatus]